MLIFIYEFVTGGGWWQVDGAHPPAGSLLAEGRAMLRCLATDFSRVAGCEVVCLADARLDTRDFPDVERVSVGNAVDEDRALCGMAVRADWTIVIAPEFDGHLERRVVRVGRAGVRLLSPDAEFVRLASHKHETAEWLRAAGVPTPRGWLWRAEDPPPDVHSPAQQSGAAARSGVARNQEPTATGGSRSRDHTSLVIKPVDGAGSQQVRLISRLDPLLLPVGASPQWRVEEFYPGVAASVSVLAGPSGSIVLPAARQRLSDDGYFQYLGGELPLPEELDRRAARLAINTAQALPATMGYFGIDLVLGDAADGRDDVVIEVNPRLTTSYVGLRRICRENLAAAMLRVVLGEKVALSFDRSPVTFTPAGFVDDRG